MPELIDKQEALKNMCEACGYCEGFEKSMRSTHPDFVCDKCNSYKFIARQPTIEEEPVRHGRWIKSDVHTFKKCSECGSVWDAALCDNIFFIYCPRCGSKNGGVENAGSKDG